MLSIQCTPNAISNLKLFIFLARKNVSLSCQGPCWIQPRKLLNTAGMNNCDKPLLWVEVILLKLITVILLRDRHWERLSFISSVCPCICLLFGGKVGTVNPLAYNEWQHFMLSLKGEGAPIHPLNRSFTGKTRSLKLANLEIWERSWWSAHMIYRPQTTPRYNV